MFGFLRQMTEKKDKKILANLAVAFAVGIALMIGGNLFLSEKTGGKPPALPDTDAQPQTPQTANAAGIQLSYEQQLEKRLEAVYESVEGAGKVTVMLTLAYGREIVVAEDVTRQESFTKETDGHGVSREQHSESAQSTKIIVPGQGGSAGQPLILKEIEPKVEGVIIVAQGGDNIHVRDALVRATQTVLGVEPHKVQVLKMSKNER